MKYNYDLMLFEEPKRRMLYAPYIGVGQNKILNIK